MKKKIFVITGEISGDILASEIISHLNFKSFNIEGITGYNLKKMGIKGPFENSDITFFGITDVLKNFFYIKNKIDQTVKYIENFKPDIVFSIDSPDFVFRVIDKIKKRKKIKTKFFHFVAPSIWAWREGRGNKIKKLLDKIYLLFEFEQKYFNKYNISNQFVGHPFFNNFTHTNSNYSIQENLLSFCPGSRKKEITSFMPIFLEIINHYTDKFNYHFALTKGTEEIVMKYLSKLKNIKYFVHTDDDLKNEYLKKSLIAISKSGTISLDLCKNQVPFFTIYKLSWINYLIIKPFVKVKYVNIINIISDKEIIPEFIQYNCTSKKIISKPEDFLTNKQKFKELVHNYNSIIDKFSNKDSSKQIANDIIKNLS